METTVKFAFTNVTNSITNSNSIVFLDANAPFSFTEFLKHTDSLYGPTIYNDFYTAYLKAWYGTVSKATTNEEQFIQKQYVSLLKEISLTYTTEDERRYLQNINFEDPEDLEIVIPFYVKKIKEIILFYKSRRDKTKFVIEKNKRKTTDFAIERAIKENIIDYLFDSNTRSVLNLDIDQITNDLQIEVEELVDTFGAYLDLSKPPANYGSQSREDFFSSNLNEVNADDIIGLTNSLKKTLFNNVFLKELGTAFTINVNLNYDPVCSPNNPIGYFIREKTFNGVPPDAQPALYKKLLEKYIGVDLYYITKDTTGAILSGRLLTSANPSGNLINTKNASTATIPANDLAPLKKIGLFFNEDNLGMLKFGSSSFTYEIDSTKLVTGETYVYPDPLAYGSNNAPVIFTTNNIQDINNISIGFGWGDVKSEPKDQSFYAYYSNQQTFETADINKNGLIDQFTELYNSGYAYDWKEDVYGNEYGIFKDVGGQYSYGELSLDDITNESYFVKLLAFNGWLFTDFRPASSAAVYTNSGPYNGINNVIMSGISANCGTFTGTTTPYYLNFRSFTPYQDIPASYDLYPTLDPKNWVLQDQVLDGNKTLLSTATGSNTTRSVIEKCDLQGKLFVKNIVTNTISPLSTALYNTFFKYPSAVKTEIYNNVKDFELYYNTIVLYTDNYIVIDKIEYEVDDFVKPKTFNIYKISNQNAFNKISNTFFIPKLNQLLFYVTDVGGYVNDNYKIIYPTLYVYDLINNDIKQIYPDSNTTQTELFANFSLSGLQGEFGSYPVNIIEVTTPKLTYNSYNDLFALTFIGKDSNKSPFVFDYKFKYRDNEVTVHESTMFDINEAAKMTKVACNFYTTYAYSNPYAILGNMSIIGTLSSKFETSLPLTFNLSLSTVVVVDYSNGLIQI